MSVLARPRDIPRAPPGLLAQTCDAWDGYTAQNVVDQIDAGS